MSASSKPLYIGLMSGTSLDGIDCVLADFSERSGERSFRTVATAYLPFPPALREELMALQSPGENEIHREAQAANALARRYAECVAMVVEQSGASRSDIRAIGAHGQTIRHRPELGYTRQTNNPALLAELTGIDVIADLRSRDIAAGGQGAPLVPAFHEAAFGDDVEVRVVANIGGISNISVLTPNRPVIGFDTGPGNVLMDAWIHEHQGLPYDEAGKWGASGMVIPALLELLRAEPFFALPPPKSTGRDLFHPIWLRDKLAGFSTLLSADIQATLAAFTATTLADSIVEHAPGAKTVYICGGGASNDHLMQQLQSVLTRHDPAIQVRSTDSLGIPPNHVEALAFAWLAYRHLERKPGNLPSATGARGERILGALFPA